MFDIGLQELAVVFVAALVVLGPERIPGAARQLGRAFVEIKRAARDLKRTVEQEWEEDDPE
jgi:sec-independent protein translocase protein TatB